MTPISLDRRYSLKRRKPTVSPKPRILVLCEGKKTEPSYLTHWKYEIRTTLVEIEIDATGAVPKTLVEKAVARKKEAAKESRKRDDENLIFNEVWCVFDVDEHPNVAEAKQQAADNDIHLAISNPCFELWLSLHFQQQNAYLDRAAAKRICSGYLKDYEKKVTAQMFAALRDGFDEAKQRAVRLGAMHESAGRARDYNPSSGVGVLIERLLELRKK